MKHLHTVRINTGYCMKELSVYCGDVTLFPEPIDVLTTSAFVGAYAPTPRTVFGALNAVGISVKNLARWPEFDLRNPCHVWLSKEVVSSTVRIKRIGCIELLGRHLTHLYQFEAEQTMINSMRAYFQMLDIASMYGADMTTLALPLLGAGNQNISGDMLLIPLINECIAFLKRNHSVKRVCFIEYNEEKAGLIAECLKKSLQLLSDSDGAEPAKKEVAFISYSSKDKPVADRVCAKLEENGVKVWYAPRDVKGTYANAIVEAIESASYFVVILSRNSMPSEHVLNEVDLAFQNLKRGIKIKPLRIDDTPFTPAFKYYLTRQQWVDAFEGPIEERLNEFARGILNEQES